MDKERKKENTPEAENDEVLSLFHEVRHLIQSARNTAVYQINTLQVLTNFEIGRLIVECEQSGEKRAEYGKKVLRELSLK